jgi:hypothetical protein
MAERYFVNRPQATAMVQWMGNNLEEVRDFWEPKGFAREQFDVNGTDLTNPSGINLPLGTFLVPMGGFGWISEADAELWYQEVDNPIRMKYGLVEEPLA